MKTVYTACHAIENKEVLQDEINNLFLHYKGQICHLINQSSVNNQ